MSLRRRRGRAAAKDNGANEHDDSKIDNVVDDAKDDVEDHHDQSADTAPFTTVGPVVILQRTFVD